MVHNRENPSECVPFFLCKINIIDIRENNIYHYRNLLIIAL